MTSAALKRNIEALGLRVEENEWARAIDIIVDAPVGFQFPGGMHSLVTHWFSNYPEARAAALEDAKANLPLEPCPADCECRDAEESI